MNKLKLISQLLECDYEIVQTVYNNIPNKLFLAEQKQLFEQHNIPVRLGYSILACMDRAGIENQTIFWPKNQNIHKGK